MEFAWFVSKRIINNYVFWKDSEIKEMFPFLLFLKISLSILKNSASTLLFNLQIVMNSTALNFIKSASPFEPYNFQKFDFMNSFTIQNGFSVCKVLF